MKFMETCTPFEKCILSFLLYFFTGYLFIFMLIAITECIREPFGESWSYYLKFSGLALLLFGLMYLNYRLRLSKTFSLICCILLGISALLTLIFAIAEALWIFFLCALFNFAGFLLALKLCARWTDIKKTD